MGFNSDPDCASDDINNQNSSNNSKKDQIKNETKSLNDQCDKKKKLNLLVLGETGTGKSTFFNSIINYLSFESLSEALECENKELLYKIPVKINIWDKNEREYNFNVGQFDREIKVGESVTKLCTTYTVNLSDEVDINFTDTPGIGDCDGVSADSENFEKILNELAEIKELHGILIILSPNSDRLTVTFRYVINELFTRLHESARHNVFFCFTKTRGTMFKPGPGLSILKRHLNNLYQSTGIEITTEGKYFCLDNEAFSYLMAKKFTNAEFEEGDEECYSTSWDKSSQTIYRIIDAVSKVNPHLVSNSICVNNARAMINKTKYPLMQCMDKVQTTIQNIVEYNKELEKCKDNCDKLNKLLFKDVTHVEHLPLPNPYIFCKNAQCLKNKTKIEGKGTVNGHICVTDDTDLKKESWLYFRKTINLFGNCKKCSHSLKDHSIEINTEFQNEMKVKDENVNEQIKKEDNKIIELRDDKIKMLKDQLCDLEYTKNVLVWALLKFSIFLNNHSLVPINQDYKEYLEKEIKIKESEGNTESLERLNQKKEDYDYYVNQIKDIKYNHNNFKIPTPEEIFEIFERVKALKLTSSFFIIALDIQYQVLEKNSDKSSKNHIEIRSMTKLKSAISWLLKQL